MRACADSTARLLALIFRPADFTSHGLQRSHSPMLIEPVPYFHVARPVQDTEACSLHMGQARHSALEGSFAATWQPWYSAARTGQQQDKSDPSSEARCSFKVVSGTRNTRLESASSLCEDICRRWRARFP